jgi:hypothetical protein
MISDAGIWMSCQVIQQLICGRLSFLSGFGLFRGNVIEWHQDVWVHCSCVIQDGSCDFLYVQTLFCREGKSVILR